MDIPEVKRNVFFPGQQLTAEDLADLSLANRELRWLHNRALHSWGIGVGLEAKGERGDSVVTIEPGYAIDCLGREIILATPQNRAVPAVAGQGGAEAIFYLVIAYKDDADQQVVEKRPGVCQPGGSVRLGEDPLLGWRLPNDLQEGRDIVLARANIQNCRLSRPLSLAERRNARPSQQPYIYGGQTGSQDTPWQEWLANGKRLGVWAQVDTSIARFHTQPVYMAHVVGERAVMEQMAQVLLIGLAAVVDPAPDHFTLQVLVPNIDQIPNDLLAALKRLNWYVVWMGVEG